MKQILRDFLCPQPKSKIKAGDGQLKGAYNFYTSSQIKSKFYHSATYTQPALIFGTGGTASVHYCNEPFSTSTDCLVMYGRHDAPLELIYYYLRSNMHLLQDGFKGAGLQHISKDYILNINIDMPAPSLQKQITHQMRLIDAMINGKKQQILSFDEAVKSRFIELFGDPVSNPKDWNVVPLGKRCEIITGNTPSRSEPENYGEYIEWIKSDNINTPFTFITKAQECLSEAGFEKCRFVEAGSILMTCIAGSINCIGNVAVTDRRVAFNQQINAIVPKQDEVLYLFWLMQLSKPMIHRTINMALKGILSKSQLSEIAFPFPPITLQEQFAAFVEQTDKSKLFDEMEVAA